MLNKKFIPSSLKNKTRITIKSLSVQSEDPETIYQEKWPILKQSILSVFSEQKSEHNFEILYRYVEDICRKHFEERLFVDIRFMFVEHAKSIRQILEKNLNSNEIAFLKLIVDTWTKYKQHILTIRNIFLVLDRNYILQLVGPIKSLWDMGVDLFRSSIIDVYAIKSKLVNQLLELIQTERNGEIIDSHFLTTSIELLTSLHVYEQVFQEALLNNSTTYYKREASQKYEEILHISSLNTGETIEQYLQWVRKIITQEEYFVNHYFPSITKEPLLSTLYSEIIEKYSSSLLEIGFESLMIQKKENYLKELYILLQNVGKLDLLKQLFFEFIVNQGTLIVKDSQKDPTMVQEILQLHKEILHIHNTCFQKSNLLMQTIKEGFFEFINSRPKKPAEMIAKYLDRHMQKGSKILSEQELENVMDEIMTIFKYIRETDVFEAFYKKDLAKRLLLDRSVSTEIEKTMLSKLREECGSEFTRKLEGMFKDMESNNILITDFTESEESKKCEVPFHVQVITNGNWPPYQSISMNLPSDLSRNQKLFEDFYLKKFSGRKLIWQNHLGRCSLIGRFPLTGEKTLDVSLFQASILLLFNSKDILKYNDFSSLLEMEENELKLTLKSLTNSKLSPITKNEGEICNDSIFSFNSNFHTPKMKIKINAIQSKETKKENEETSQKVMSERVYVIDAAIVRVMKARKELYHQELLASIMKILKFPATFQDIKKRIDSLIERDYISRDPDDLTKIIYCS